MSSPITCRSAMLQPIDIEFENLGLRLKTNGRSVLAGVTGAIKHGRFTAVMGPSEFMPPPLHTCQPLTSNPPPNPPLLVRRWMWQDQLLDHLSRPRPLWKDQWCD